MKGEAVILSRRSVLAGSGALVVNFSSLGRVAAQQGGGEQGAAMRALAAAARWQETATLPNGAALPDFLKAQPARDIAVLDARAAPAAAAKSLSATYTRPYIAHGSIGPSCAVALYDGDAMTIWSHTQGVNPLRGAIAEMLGMPKDKVRCIHAEGAGCYGHNAADDAAADAALLARAVPGRPVRLQWMREQEHAWEPYGPAMAVKVEAGLDASGKVIDWDYTLWSNTHATRPGPAGSLIAARSLAAPFQQPAPRPIPMPEGGGDRNSIPLYQFPSARVMHHFIPAMPVRVSALRALGAHMNVFAIESFMDELAAAAGADPVQFRLQHLDDARARDVISAVAQRFGWSDTSRRKLPGRGRGFAFARYKNLPPIAPSPARWRSNAKPATRAWCVPSPPSMPAGWSIPRGLPTRSRARFCSR